MAAIRKTVNGFVRSHMSYESVTRLDIVFDTYPEENLKTQNHQCRGTRSRTKVDGRTPIPKRNWNSDFLKNEDNKDELFGYISEEITKHGMSGKLLLSTKKDSVLSNRPGYDMSALQPCNHPEADTRIILHLAHAGVNGHKKAFVQTVDSDVVILAIRFFNTLGLTELWIGFAGGKNYRDIPAHEISKDLGPQKSLALPLFHALTGCDTTSAFLGHGIKSAWAAWEATPDLTESLGA